MKIRSVLTVSCLGLVLAQQEHHRSLFADFASWPLIGGYEVCVGFETQVVAIWTYVLYLVLGPFFDATVGACIGRDGWVWGDQGASCTAACDAAGGVCDLELTQGINNTARFQFVESKFQDLEEFNCQEAYVGSTTGSVGVPFTEFSTALNRLVCAYYTAAATTTCDDAISSARRICCCDADICETSP